MNISVNEFGNTYLRGIDRKEWARILEMYSKISQGYSFSQFFSGSQRAKLRTLMSNANLITFVTNTYPKVGRRIVPMGKCVEFDLYNKKGYTKKDKNYFVQIRFRLWFPYGYVDTSSLDNLKNMLLVLFENVASRMFATINVFASLKPFTEEEFSIGLHRMFDCPARNIDTFTVLISKVHSTSQLTIDKIRSSKVKVDTYSYDYLVRYRYGYNKTGSDVYFVDMCYAEILRAVSCLSRTSLLDNFVANFREKTGQYIDIQTISMLRKACDFNWKIYIPDTYKLCSNTYSINFSP